MNICPPTQCRAALHDKFHIQTRQVRQAALTAPMDELTAALANFAFHIVAIGDVRFLGAEKTGSRYQVSIRRVGIYVRDKYDFNDEVTSDISQPLGVWDCNPEYVGNNFLRGRYLTNESFRNWRSRHGKGRGGDYLVFSDIHWREVNDSFEFVR